MSTPDWVQDAIFYQIFPDRFAKSDRNPAGKLEFESWEAKPTYHGFKGGDLYGVAEKMSHLKNLGINAIYFNPIFSSASNHRYHTYDYYNVDPLLGGNDAFKKLLDKAHKNGIRVVLDGVFNHASRGLWQFHHVLETGSASPYQDWFYFDPERLNGNKHWGAYPTHHEETQIKNEGSFKAIGYKAWWDLPALPKFNTNTPAVREFIFDIAEYWIKMGIDGWRLDVPAEIDDDSFWQEFRHRVKKINPEAYIVGEIWHEAERWLQGDQFDGVMNYLISTASMSLFGGSKVNMDTVNQCGGLQGRVHPDISAHDFANEIDRLMELYKPEIVRSQLNLLDSHDMPRFLSCVSGDKNALKLAWLFIMTIPGAPCIYYGDEVGMEGGHDPDCRRGFPWDESQWDKDLLGNLKRTIGIRKENPTLRHGDFRRLWSDHGVYAFSRNYNDKSIVVALNASESPQQIHVTYEPKKVPKPLFGNPSEISLDDRLRFTVPPRSGIVLK